MGVDINLFRPLDINKSVDVLFIGSRGSGYNLLEETLKLFKIKPKLHTIFREDTKVILDKNLVEIYNKSKVLIALNRGEPFGLIPLESMACGTPVIAVYEGGYRESIVNNETGFFIKRDSLELFDKINIIINNEKLRKKMSENARAHSLNNWTWDRSIDRFLKIINYAR